MADTAAAGVARSVSFFRSKTWTTTSKVAWAENPVFVQMLGICGALAVTNKVSNTFVMCVAVLLVLIGSNVTISALRNLTPKRTRMLVQTMIIATYVVIVDLYLKAYVPDISKALGAYVGLIITNCIIMGRAEAFAGSNKPWLSACDGFGAGMGYAIVLMPIAVVRELMGFGTIFDIQIMGDWWVNWSIMIMAPAGFLGLGAYIWVARSLVKQPQ